MMGPILSKRRFLLVPAASSGSCTFSSISLECTVIDACVGTDGLCVTGEKCICEGPAEVLGLVGAGLCRFFLWGCSDG